MNVALLATVLASIVDPARMTFVITPVLCGVSGANNVESERVKQDFGIQELGIDALNRMG